MAPLKPVPHHHQPFLVVSLTTEHRLQHQFDRMGDELKERNAHCAHIIRAVGQPLGGFGIGFGVGEILLIAAGIGVPRRAHHGCPRGVERASSIACSRIRR